ncbi:hypothetical protein L2D14_16340 [Thalassospiraceae bacterium LMO-JJ14]|nr:hypothetical protein L2D14_16340 [Thalassospiraceae bacterium LMO-JJ14]
MLYLILAVLWPLAFVGLYFGYPLVFPDKTPPDEAILFIAALLGMAAFTFAGALRILGFLRDDKMRREKSRDDAANDGPG